MDMLDDYFWRDYNDRETEKADIVNDLCKDIIACGGNLELIEDKVRPYYYDLTSYDKDRIAFMTGVRIQ